VTGCEHRRRTGEKRFPTPGRRRGPAVGRFGWHASHYSMSVVAVVHVTFPDVATHRLLCASVGWDDLIGIATRAEGAGSPDLCIAGRVGSPITPIVLDGLFGVASRSGSRSDLGAADGGGRSDRPRVPE
jgi:hypothetical protein